MNRDMRKNEVATALPEPEFEKAKFKRSTMPHLMLPNRKTATALQAASPYIQGSTGLLLNLNKCMLYQNFHFTKASMAS